MELTLQVEQHGSAKTGENIRGALESISENAGHIKQGLAKLKGSSTGYATAFRMRFSDFPRHAKRGQINSNDELLSADALYNHFSARLEPCVGLKISFLRKI